MSIRVKVKQSSKCKKCEGIGYYMVSTHSQCNEPVEYVCNDCDGSGVAWEDRDLPLSSLKRLLK